MDESESCGASMPQPTAHADALGHYLYLPRWEGGLRVEGAPQCEKWRRKAGTNIARADDQANCLQMGRLYEFQLP